ncbi:MAG TPA: Rne/Rng family ribonuclease [Actinomycetales bacterium]|nr:Rne/Rng family ribonuclease [Actinomycetales bacterium]
MTDQPTNPTTPTISAADGQAKAPTRRRRAASRPAGPPAAGSTDGAPTASADDSAASGAAEAPPAHGTPDAAAAEPAPPAKKAARKRAPRKKAAAATQAPEAQVQPAADAQPAAEEAPPVKKATRKRAPRKKAAAPPEVLVDAAAPDAAADTAAPDTAAPDAAAPDTSADAAVAPALDTTPQATDQRADEPPAEPAAESAGAPAQAPVDSAMVAPVDVAPMVPELAGSAPEPQDTQETAEGTAAQGPAPQEPATQEPAAQEPVAEEGTPVEGPRPQEPVADEDAATAETARKTAPETTPVETVSAPAVAVPLLFQAPEPTAAPPRRRRRAQAPAGPPVHHDEPAVADRTAEPVETPAQPRTEPQTQPPAQPPTQPQAEEPAATAPVRTEEEAEEEAGAGNRKRRRRGGRGRRARAEGSESTLDKDTGDKDTADKDTADKDTAEKDTAEKDTADTNTADKDTAEAEPTEADTEQDTADQEPAVAAEIETDGDEAPETGEAEDEEGSASNRRRRRRRRRAGSAAAEEASTEDPPGTVTKLRQPRRGSEGREDEVASVKGSTRLEAKKQRRRDGREAGRRKPIITESEFLARRESVERTMIVRERAGRTQIAVLEDDVLVEHYVANETNASMIGNVYLGRVQNVLPSMEAAFIDIGKGRNAVLYAGEVNWDAAGLEGGPRRIEAALKSGDSVLVQVTKDPMGHKGARLTSQVSLPGRYLVYVPNSSMTGISRKLPDTERSRLKKILKAVVPEDGGVIVRTAAEGASEEELQHDVERLAAQWEDIQRKASSSSGGSAPKLLHGEPDLTVRVVRDVFNEDFSRLIVSGGPAWEVVQPYVSSVAPDLAERISRWTSEEDVFAAYRVDEQLTKAMDRKVWLPSGGSLVIDRTEAMTVVDVNTGKFTGAGGNLEETVTRNNLEAAEEVVRQLRLRDIGGIIVVDFIDMVLESNRELVLRRLVECLGRDRTKHQVAEVTSLGLVQMTRKRVGQGLLEVFSEPCEHCHGRGVVVHAEPVGRSNGAGNGAGAGNGSGAGGTAGSGAAAGGSGAAGKNGDQGRSRGKGRSGKGGGVQTAVPATPPPAPRKPIPAGLVASLAHHGEPLAHPDDPDAAPVAPRPAAAEPAIARSAVGGSPAGGLAVEVAQDGPVQVEAVLEGAPAPEAQATHAQAEPAQAEPAQAEPTQSEPTRAEPAQGEPTHAAEQSPSLPTQAEVAPVESGTVESGTVEPGPVESGTIESRTSGPVESGTVEPAPEQPRRRRRRASAPSGPPPGSAVEAAATPAEPAATPVAPETTPAEAAGDAADVEASPS